MVILISVLLGSELGGLRGWFHSERPNLVSQIREIFSSPVSEVVQQLVCLQAFVVAASWLNAVDHLKLIFRLIAAQDEALCDIGSLDGG